MFSHVFPDFPRFSYGFPTVSLCSPHVFPDFPQIFPRLSPLARWVHAAVASRVVRSSAWPSAAPWCDAWPRSVGARSVTGGELSGGPGVVMSRAMELTSPNFSRGVSNYIWLVVWLPSIWHFPINIGLLSSSQLTNSYFFRGVAQPPTRYEVGILRAKSPWLAKYIYLQDSLWVLKATKIHGGASQLGPRANNHGTSSTASRRWWKFQNRKPIGEVGGCESWMAERNHWWIYLSIHYLSIYLSIYPSIYLSVYLSIYLSIYLSTLASLVGS